jgi:hypothetical protein
MWCSLGALAVIDSDGIRGGFVAPFWTLAALVIGFASAAYIMRLSSRTSIPLFLSVLLVLPWLPFRVPSAFLLWTGHVTVAVWLAVAMAMLIASGVRVPAWLADVRHAPRAAALIAFGLYLFAGFRLAGLVPGGDEPHYLVITQSVLKDGDLRIENNHAQLDYRVYFPGQLRPDFLRRGTNGEIYSIHAPGLPVVVAPAFALFGYRGAVVFLSIVAALGTGLLWRASFALTGSSTAAWFAWATGGLTVPFFFQSFAIYPDSLGATLVLFAVMPLLMRSDSPIDNRRAGAVGLALALLPWLHTRFAVLSAAIGFVLLLRLLQTPEGRWRAVVLLASPVLSALAWFGFFRAIYGTFNPSAPYGGDTQSTAANILNGLPALFLDQQFGILPYAPVYGVCLAGMVVLARRRPRLALELLTIIVPYVLVTSMFHMWWAGSVSPARLLVPVLPLLALPGAWLWGETRSGATRAMAATLLMLSVAITLSLLVVESGRLVYNFRDGFSLAAERLSPIVDVPRGLPSFFRQTPVGATFRGFVWAAIFVAAFLALQAIERLTESSARRPVLALAAPASVSIVMMLALTIVWKMDAAQAATPQSSQLALLRSYDQRWKPFSLSFNPLHLGPADRLLAALNISTPTRRPLAMAGTLLIAPGVIPAGDYELRPKDRLAWKTASGTAKLVIGRLARPVVVWEVGEALTDRGLAFNLPVDVGSLVVEGNEQAAAAGGLMLHPKRVARGDARVSSGWARRAERYGPGTVYFFDDAAFPEEPGFWIRGGQVATVAVAGGTPTRLALFLRNAPIKNRIFLEIDGRPQVVELSPGEERTLPLALSSDRTAALIRFRTETGFRPSEHEQGSADNRFLGIWVEVR